MPLVLLILAAMVIVVGLKGNFSAVAHQLDVDLLGEPSANGTPAGASFLLWIGAILFIAVVGKILNIPTASKLFMVLILCVYLVSNAGVFAQFDQAFAQVQSPATSYPFAANANNTSSASSGVAPTSTTTANPGQSIANSLTGALTSQISGLGSSLIGSIFGGFGL